MPKAKAQRVQSREEPPALDAEAFLESAGAARRIVSYPEGKIVFSQGPPSEAVMYIQKGTASKYIESLSADKKAITIH